MITYEQWNKVIISYFFEDCEPGEIVFLQIDDDLLSEIAESANFNVADAIESLKVAVRNKVARDNSVNLWKVDPSTAHLWNDYSENEPSQVAFLALTVLAASQMDRKGSVASSNYYVRLNELLFDQPFRGTPQGFDRPQFEVCWKHLQKWARDQHNVVFYLTEGSSTRRYVWYPISQCLINNRDRRVIYRFFRDHGLNPFSKIPDNQLEKYLRTWLRRTAASTKIERYLSNAYNKKVILNQVQSLLKHWDGLECSDDEMLPKQIQGQRQTTSSPINVELRFNKFDNAEIRYWFRRRGRNEIECRTNPFGINHLQAFSSDQWFRPVIDADSIFWNLADRLQLQTDEANPIIYTLNSSDVWVFREDSERDDGWLSQRNMQLYENHLIVFRRRLREQVIDCLRQACEQEFEESNLIYVDGEKQDWLYVQVEPTQFVSFSDHDLLWKLSVDSNERISFMGGLSVKNQDAQKAYLDFCLPTVFVPDLGLSDEEFLSVGDQAFPVREDRLVPLDNALEPGFHLLNYGGQTRELRIISPERSLEQHEQTLTAAITEDRRTMPIYAETEVSEIAEESGIWLTGAKFFGTSIPEVTWDDVRIEPRIEEQSERQSLKSPAERISSIVKLAIELKSGQVSVPEWLIDVMKDIDQNVAMRTLIQRKLQQYHETALSYADLYRRAGG